MIGSLLALAAAWEAFWWQARCVDRSDAYRRALACSRRTGKPLLVVGAPDRGATRSPEGDIVLDIGPSCAPVAIRADVCRRIPLPDDSVVAFVSCVLEYVEDLPSAVRELRRVAGDRLFVARVQPWTLASRLYPGARRTIDPSRLGS